MRTQVLCARRLHLLLSSHLHAPLPLVVDASHFTMMKVVGKGGFGKVNAVTHRLTGQLMAMKRMKKSKLGACAWLLLRFLWSSA